jgi:hypothetical protein
MVLVDCGGEMREEVTDDRTEVVMPIPIVTRGHDRHPHSTLTYFVVQRRDLELHLVLAPHLLLPVSVSVSVSIFVVSTTFTSAPVVVIVLTYS